MEKAIIVKDVKKKFKVYLDKGNSLKEKVLFRSRNKYEERWVLNGISFEIAKGEAVGLIGHNGCGKSTTLKLLNRIMYPDSGSIEMKGKVSSLIELGAGFHPDMSGKENIYINASIFGLTKKQIDTKINDIIAFSELEKFIDNPVRTYSSGMYMRLAFSVAINVDADILLIDEILAVGDSNFQKKCYDKLKELRRKGITIIIVSHSLTQIESICDRTIWIHEGLIKYDDNCVKVHELYNKFMEDLRKKELKVINEVSNKENKRWGNGNIQWQKFYVYNGDGKETKIFNVGDDIIIKSRYIVKKEVSNAIFGINIFRKDGICCYKTNTLIDKYDKFKIKNDGEFSITLKNINLLSGRYYIDMSIKEDINNVIDFWKEAIIIDINSEIKEEGILRLEHEWNY